MKRFSVIIAVTVGLGAMLFALPGRSQPTDGVRKFMKPKLTASQHILEGLSLEDFSLIGENAKRLLRLSEAAEWQVLPSPEYVRYSADFQRLTNDLVVAANDRDLDAATLAYVQLTINCVNCHKHVRDARRVADAR